MSEPKISDIIQAIKSGRTRDLTFKGVTAPNGTKVDEVIIGNAADAKLFNEHFGSVFQSAPAAPQYPPKYRRMSAHGVLTSVRQAQYLTHLAPTHLKYRKSSKRVIQMLIDICGDLPPDDYEPDIVDHFIERLKFLPLNPDKNKVHRERWAKLNFKQLTNEVEFLDIPRAADPTVVNHIEVLGGFFTFCKERRYMEHSSPLLARIKKKAIDKDQPKRRGFSADDLLQIFDLDTYQSRNYPHSFWPPLIALLTGARCNEIAQLYLDDIVNDDSAHPDRWRIMIRKPRPDQRLKNKFSNRSIPIHPRLIELGFLHYLDDVRALGFERVFPALRYTEAAGYGDTVSDMFSGYLRKKVKITDPLKVFHSFRHYFCTQALNQTQHEMLRIYDITGHEREGEFALTYARELHYENKMAILIDIPLPKMELPIYRPGMFTAKLLATKMKKASEAAEASRLAKRTPAEIKKDEAAAAVKASSVKRDPNGFTIKVSKPRKPKVSDLASSTGVKKVAI